MSCRSNFHNWVNPQTHIQRRNFRERRFCMMNVYIIWATRRINSLAPAECQRVKREEGHLYIPHKDGWLAVSAIRDLNCKLHSAWSCDSLWPIRAHPITQRITRRRHIIHLLIPTVVAVRCTATWVLWALREIHQLRMHLMSRASPIDLLLFFVWQWEKRIDLANTLHASNENKVHVGGKSEAPQRLYLIYLC